MNHSFGEGGGVNPSHLSEESLIWARLEVVPIQPISTKVGAKASLKFDFVKMIGHNFSKGINGKIHNFSPETFVQFQQFLHKTSLKEKDSIYS